VAARTRGVGARDTRGLILSAAEDLFAERGFAETRLEDVAAEVGVKRAALFYYFKDNRALYAAVLEDLFGNLLEQVRDVAERPGLSIREQIEEAVSVWVRCVWARPSIARILMAESSRRTENSELFDGLVQPFLTLLNEIFAEGNRQGVFHPITSHPLHFASAVVGSTIFFVAGMPNLVRDMPFDPLSESQCEIHLRDTLRVTRRLLGLAGPRNVD
jgi:TetR/AcrR family transcriptional regulator